MFNNDYNAKVKLSYHGREEVIWWIDNVITTNGLTIRRETPNLILETDAPQIGWGAVIGKNSTQGRWSSKENTDHINILELKAIYFALRSLCSNLLNTDICIRTDSSTAVSYINNQGGSIIPLLEISKKIWLWCAERNIFISAVHIAVKMNFEPDNLSRIFKNTSEWKLKESIFQKITYHFFLPEIDLFASRINRQLAKYVSWFPDPEALQTDAFPFSWHNINPYIFPPFSQICRILQKIREEKVSKAILIAPLWTTQVWYLVLPESLIDCPAKLPQCSDLVTLVHSGQKHPMNKRKMFLCAFLVSGDISLIQGFQRKLHLSSPDLGEHQLINNMNINGEIGFCGAIQNKLIPLHLL